MADDSGSVAAPPQTEPESTTAAPTEPTKEVETTSGEQAPPAVTDALAEEAPEAAETSDMKATEEPAADASATSAANGAPAPTPSSKAKPTKRSSTSGTPAKKLNRKKSMPNLHLNVKPGEYWYVLMKGYPPWPAIICDEDMLPPSLLSKRPVSAMRVDGTYREDFEEGGKNARDRRYPVMFLGTNEFGWHVNTDLSPLDLDELKGIVERNEQGKKNKTLWNAFQIAAEGNDLDYFKKMLVDHEQGRQEEERAFLEAEEARLAKLEKKGAVDDDGDVDMEDADTPVEKKKPSKKRKKSTTEGDEDTGKKTKIVLKGLKASGDEEQVVPTKKKARKSKGPESEEPEAKTQAAEEPAANPEEHHKRRLKTIMYLRHKLQKGLISRQGPPQAEDMDTMDEHLQSLETFQDLEVEIIRESKVNKLLKVILKLNVIPRDEEFQFKQRCTKLLAAWSQILQDDDAKNAPPAANGLTNGKAEESRTEEPAVEKKEEDPVKSAEPVTNGKTEEPAKSAEPEAVPAAEDKMDVTA